MGGKRGARVTGLACVQSGDLSHRPPRPRSFIQPAGSNLPHFRAAASGGAASAGSDDDGYSSAGSLQVCCAPLCGGRRVRVAAGVTLTCGGCLQFAQQVTSSAPVLHSATAVISSLPLGAGNVGGAPSSDGGLLPFITK